MKQLISACAFVFVSLFTVSASFAQGVSYNTTGTPANPSAMLDVQSTSSGVLVPRMTTTQRNAIASPATGLMIFQTDGTAGYYYYSGSAWTMVGNTPAGSATGDMLYWNGSAWLRVPVGTSGQTLVLNGSTPTWTTTVPLFIGEIYRGGIIAYILQPGDPGYSATLPHGLIAAVADQSTGCGWGCSGTTTGATGAGPANTTAILSVCPGSPAAQVCHAYTGGGYTDWYLPNQSELYILWIYKTAIGGFSNNYYWSSTEYNASNAWSQNFLDGFQNSASKNSSYHVRAIRAF